MKRKQPRLAALAAIAAAIGILPKPELLASKPELASKPVKVCIICVQPNLGKGECCSKGCFRVAQQRAKTTLSPNATEAWDQEIKDLKRYERSLDSVDVERD